jgi:hypothetical protein
MRAVSPFQVFISFAALFAGLASAMLVFLLARAPQVYPQLVVGSLAWDGSSKAGEIAAVLTFLFVLPLAWFALSWSGRILVARGLGDPALHALQACCFPGAIWLGQSLILTNAGQGWLFLALLAITWWFCVALFLRFSARDSGDPQMFPALFGIPILAGFSALGFAYGLNRLGLHPVAIPVWPAVFLIAGGLLMSALRLFRRSVWRMDLPRLVCLSQLGIPVLAVALIPTPIAGAAGLRHPVPLSWPLAGLVLSIGLAVLWDILRRLREVGSDLWCAISPGAVLLCLWILKSPGSAVPSIPVDDWHFGESILPWVLWRDFGEIPFSDVIPVRGFASALEGLVAQVFFSGTAADITYGKPIFALGLSALVFFTFRRAAGSLAAIAAVVVLNHAYAMTQTDYFFAAGIALLAGLALQGRHRAVLIAWPLVSVVLFLLAPGPGVLLIVASSPFVLHAFWRTGGAGRWQILVAYALLALSFALFLLWPPAARLLTGIGRYFADNALINESASGVSWGTSFSSERTGSPALNELFRSSGLLIAALLIGFFIRDVRTLLAAPSEQSLFSRKDVECVLGAVVVLSILVFLPRVLGRIDPASSSRLGALSLLVAGGLAPLVLIRRSSRTAGMSFLAVALLLASGIRCLSPHPNDGGASVQAEALLVMRSSNVATSAVVDGRAHGLSNTGKAEFEPGHLARLQELRTLLDAMLPAGQPYYDLTNHNAHYAYFSRPVPASWSSPFYQADERAQVRTVRELSAGRIPLLLLSANNIEHDGGSAALRTYWLYRFVLADYLPFEENGYLFAVRRDLATEPGFSSRLKVQREDVVELFDQAFAVDDLLRIPASWGASYRSLRAEFGPEALNLATSSQDGGDTRLVARDRSDGEIPDPGRFDVLTVLLSCRESPGGARVFWSSRRGGASVQPVCRFLRSVRHPRDPGRSPTCLGPGRSGDGSGSELPGRRVPGAQCPVETPAATRLNPDVMPGQGKVLPGYGTKQTRRRSAIRADRVLEDSPHALSAPFCLFDVRRAGPPRRGCALFLPLGRVRGLRFLCDLGLSDGGGPQPDLLVQLRRVCAQPQSEALPGLLPRRDGDAARHFYPTRCQRLPYRLGSQPGSTGCACQCADRPLRVRRSAVQAGASGLVRRG